MDGVWGEGWTSLKTPGAFQRRFFRILFFLVIMGTEAPFLPERAEARQDFFSFFRFFLAASVA
jgi:hypothetical protein